MMSKINGHPVMGNEEYLRGYNDALNKCRWNIQAAHDDADHYRAVLEQLEKLVMEDWLRDMIRVSLDRPPVASE